MASADDRRLTDSGIEVKPVYTADDAPSGELGLPGEFPFTRGPYETMYRGRPWTIRQYAGYGSADCQFDLAPGDFTETVGGTRIRQLPLLYRVYVHES